ncbi:Fic/DOC family protein [Gracilibacillus sp. D59]|uniref:Fic/DOC family protein n=1 Tax=Gracilibacillus sp. D59 TaxID=3457434 RepID=UPI003FCE588F
MDKYNNEQNDQFLLEVNLLGAETYEELKEAEAFAFAVRAAELERTQNRIKSFKESDFQELHRYLFQDIYPFAGQYRNVQLSKGNTRFCQAQFISSYAAQLFEELNNESGWENKDKAAERLAYFKSELNLLHPFREGNGRTIRIFLHAYAMTMGYKWEYEKIDREAYLNAMIASVTDTNALYQLFLDSIVIV